MHVPRNSADPKLEHPRLESGDRLSRAEFERRYEAWPAIKKAELIEGLVYVPSPSRFRSHGKPHAAVMTWLGYYAARTPGLDLADNNSVRLDLDNEPQPDALLRIPENLGGRSRVDGDDYLDGAPELIVEVASSSVSYDTGPKKNAYRRNGVQEYVIWRVLDRAIDWFTLREGAYERMDVPADGIFRSVVFPGLWLDAEALLAGRMERVLEVVDLGLAQAEHHVFRDRVAG